MHDECAFEPTERHSCGRRHDALGKWECLARGCCFDDSESVESGVPRCFLAHSEFMTSRTCQQNGKSSDHSKSRQTIWPMSYQNK